MTAVVPSEGLDRRRVDRRKAGDRRFLWRGVDRRRGDRRFTWAAAGLVVVASLGAPRPAQAQIYSWYNAKGTPVFSNRQLDPTAKPLEIATESPVRVTKAPPAVTQRRGMVYDHFIDEHAAAHGVRPELVRALIQAESNFNPHARSSKGAMGLMQLMPATAAQLGVLNPFDESENIRGGVAYLRQLLDRYDNNEALALAAYNAGPAAVDRHGSQVPPYHETQQYVKRILGWTPSPAVAAVASTKIIYKTTEMIDGQAVPRYSTSKPASGPYQTLKLG